MKTAQTKTTGKTDRRDEDLSWPTLVTQLIINSTSMMLFLHLVMIA